MPTHEKLNYVELPSRNLVATKAFFTQAFGWSFSDYGPEYIAFSDEGMDGGFFKSEQQSLTSYGAALMVFYSSKREDTQRKVAKAGGRIVKPTYNFPGGRRFHFVEPGGSEFAVWTDAFA